MDRDDNNVPSELLGSRIAFPKIIVPPCPFDESTTGSPWQYEFRGSAHMILPGIWIGPMRVLRDDQFITSNNIRTLISVCDIEIIPVAIKQNYMKNPDFKCLFYNNILNSSNNAKHSDKSKIKVLAEICHLVRVNEMQYGTQSNNILIFCETGNNQSALVASALLIYLKKVSLIAAIQYVQSRRFSISLNDESKHILQTFSDITQVGSYEYFENEGADYSKKSRSRDEPENSYDETYDDTHIKRQHLG